MCTTLVAQTAATVGIERLTKGKPLVGADIIPRPPKPPTPEPPKDITGEERRERARELRRTLAGRPGRGRAATIFSTKTGAGNPNLKQKTGQ